MQPDLDLVRVLKGLTTLSNARRLYSLLSVLIWISIEARFSSHFRGTRWKHNLKWLLRLLV